MSGNEKRVKGSRRPGEARRVERAAVLNGRLETSFESQILLTFVWAGLLRHETKPDTYVANEHC